MNQNKISKLTCTASLEAGILTLENGSKIDMGRIESTLALIAASPLNAFEDEKIHQTGKIALQNLHSALPDLPSAPEASQAPEAHGFLEGKREVFIEAYCTGEHGDSPAFAKLDVDQAFLENLKSLQNLCIENDLHEVHKYANPEKWGPGDIENELRLTKPFMIVTAHDFWFADTPKYSDGDIETRSQDIAEFTISVLALPDGERLLLGESLDYENLIDDEPNFGLSDAEGQKA